MNNKLADFARDTLKKGLLQLPEKNQRLFKQMYSPADLEKDIESVVDDMPHDRLDWAMQQVERTLDMKEVKNGKR